MYRTVRAGGALRGAAQFCATARPWPVLSRFCVTTSDNRVHALSPVAEHGVFSKQECLTCTLCLQEQALVLFSLTGRTVRVHLEELHVPIDYEELIAILLREEGDGRGGGRWTRRQSFLGADGVEGHRLDGTCMRRAGDK